MQQALAASPSLPRARVGPVGRVHPLVLAGLLAIMAAGMGHLHAVIPRAAVAAPAARGIQRAYAQLPMAFTPNRGQAAAGVAFVSGGAGYTLALSATGAVLRLAGSSPAAGADPTTGAAMTMRLLDANPHAAARGQQPLAGTTSYITGNDPARWHTGLPTVARVVFHDVYPGIDIAYHGSQGQLEYDFLVAAGADPRVIAMAFPGAGLRIDGAGDLVLATALGNLVQQRPHVYQQIAGARHEVSGRFILRTASRVGFSLGSYDPSLPLVIDPSIVYSTFLGGTGNEEGAYSIAVDGAGDAFVVGGTAPPPGPGASTDFPTTAGAYQTAPGGGNAEGDAFVTKLSPDGSRLIYSTYIGGSGFDDAAGVAIDGAGDAYIRGVTNSTDFPTTAGAFQTAQKGTTSHFSAWVAKLNPAGSALLYSTLIGGSGFNSGSGIAVDSTGSAYIPGLTGSADFPTTPGAYQTTFTGAVTTFVPPPAAPPTAVYDAFVTKLNPTGSALAYSTYLAGTTYPATVRKKVNVGFAIAVDPAGHAYVTGNTTSNNFPTTAGAFQTTAAGGGGEAWVAKLLPDGSNLAYSTYLGGSGGSSGQGIAIDPAGSAYVTGGTMSTNFPTTAGAFQTTFKGTADAYLSKLTPSGSGLVYSTLLGGSGTAGGSSGGDYGFAVAVDQAGRAYVTGGTYATNFPTTPGGAQTTAGGDEDAFVTGFQPDGSTLAYSTYLGGKADDQGLGIAVDSADDVYVAGVTLSANFPTTAGAFQTSLKGAANSFVTKLATATVPSGGVIPRGPGNTGGRAAASTATPLPGGLLIPLLLGLGAAAVSGRRRRLRRG